MGTSNHYVIFNFIMVWQQSGITGRKIKTDSKTYYTLIEFAPLTNKVISYIIPPVKNIFNNLSDWFDNLDDNEKSEEETQIII